MQKLITIIIAVNDAQESDIAIPLSSINNQLGVDFDTIEVLLIDNGTYKLTDPHQFDLLANLDLTYIQTPKRLSWQAAFQQGIERAQGQYVLLLGPNAELNQTSVLQTLTQALAENPEAEVLSGMVLNQVVLPDRTSEYKIGRDPLASAGRLISRQLLLTHDIGYPEHGEYADELFARLVHQLAAQDVKVETVVYARFVNRTVPTAVLAPVSHELSETWLKMMGQYFARLQATAETKYTQEFAKFIVRSYTQLTHQPSTEQESLLSLIRVMVKQNPAALPFAREFIQSLQQKDRSPQAPWVAAPEHFQQYLELIKL